MLTRREIAGLKVKRAQDMSYFGGPTLEDLFSEIQRDASIPAFERIQLITHLRSSTNNAPAGTPLSSLIQRGVGGILGSLIAKYFGMGGMGQVASTLAGAMMGPRLLGQAYRPFPGYVQI